MPSFPKPDRSGDILAQVDDGKYDETRIAMLEEYLNEQVRLETLMCRREGYSR
jgi:hypothetical protein